MSKICDLTKKKVMAGNNVSHAKNRRRRVFEPNLHNHRLWSEELKRWISLKLSKKNETAGMTNAKLKISTPVAIKIKIAR